MSKNRRFVGLCPLNPRIFWNLKFLHPSQIFGWPLPNSKVCANPCSFRMAFCHLFKKIFIEKMVSFKSEWVRKENTDSAKLPFSRIYFRFFPQFFISLFIRLIFSLLYKNASVIKSWTFGIFGTRTLRYFFHPCSRVKNLIFKWAKLDSITSKWVTNRAMWIIFQTVLQ